MDEETMGPNPAEHAEEMSIDPKDLEVEKAEEPKPKDSGAEDSLEKVVGPDNWDEAREAGFNLHSNLRSEYPKDPGRSFRIVEKLRQELGEQNVLTGNAWDKDTEKPTGVPGYFGVYTRETEPPGEAKK